VPKNDAHDLSPGQGGHVARPFPALRYMNASAQIDAFPAAVLAPSDALAAARPRVETFFAASEHRVFARANRFFLWLLPSQWIAAILLAVWVSPRLAVATGPLFAAIAGGCFALPALALIRRFPHDLLTRCVVALAQAGFSALFVQLTGGRVETHFHIFCALAFLALYRDWRVLPVATGAVAFHHLALALWWPSAVYGAPFVSAWRTVEFASWLLVENAALLLLCLTSRREMHETARREDEHQQLLEQLERRVRDRTRELETEMQARSHTAQVLLENEQQHRHLVATVPIGIFETTRSGKVNFANPHLLSLIGLPTGFDPTIINLGDGRIFPLADRERFWNRLENEREIRGFAATLRHFDGSAFEVVINARLKPTPPDAEIIAEGTIEDVTSRKRAARELEGLHNQLVVASRQAGMAEVATGVLHNVGNVLTSVNLIVHDVQDRLKTTRLTHLRRVVEILEREQPRLAEFLTADGAGRQLPDFLKKLDEHLVSENRQLLTDVEGLVRHFEHIREIIVTQQGSAQLFGLIETLAPSQLFEDALRLNAESMERHGIALERLFEPTAAVKADRHKVLQILVNLIKNAKDALQVVKPGERLIRVRVTHVSDSVVALSVQDNGNGILTADLKRIFQHGFTTKQSGHGFGLHSSVLGAREMGGDLVAVSAGAGQGSTFTLTLPAAKSPAP